jgi:hypothetical protein
MRRLPALLAVLVLAALSAGCASGPAPTSTAAAVAATPGDPSASADPEVSIGPAPTPELFPLLSIEWRGGECPAGLCTRLVNIEGDGRFHEVIPKDQVTGRVPPELLEALQIEIERANYRLILSRPFTGTCPTAYDGQQVIYTFHVSTGDRTVDACKVAIDPDHPLFVATDAAVRAAGG